MSKFRVGDEVVYLNDGVFYGMTGKVKEITATGSYRVVYTCEKTRELFGNTAYQDYETDKTIRKLTKLEKALK